MAGQVLPLNGDRLSRSLGCARGKLWRRPRVPPGEARARSARRVTVRRVAAWVSAAVVVAVAAVAVAATSWPWEAAASHLPPDPPFHVNGHLLVQPNGRRFVVKGVTVEALPFYRAGAVAGVQLAEVTGEDFRARDAIFRTLRAEGANTVRIPLGYDVYSGDDSQGGAGYLRRLGDVVAAARAEHLIAILSWWDSLGAGANLPSRYRQWLPMMGAVERAFKGDPGVLYEPLNEPNHVDWTTWRAVMTGVVDYWRRDLRYRGPLILDTIDYSWSFDPASAIDLLALDTRLLGTADLLFANHRYANANPCFCGRELDDWVGSVGTSVSRFPILGTEYGAFDGHWNPHLAWNREFLRYVAERAIPDGLNGAVVFVYHWVDANALAVRGTSTPTAWGSIADSELLGRRMG